MTRKYSSPRREEQAKETRRKILEAAYGLFTRRGYGGATIESIAREAGVAAETAYAVFGNKRKILLALADTYLADRPATATPRPLAQFAGRQEDAYKQVLNFATETAAFFAQAAALFEILNEAAKMEDEVGEALRRAQDKRLYKMQNFIGSLPSRRATAETVWAVASPDVYLLTSSLGWSVEQYQTWLADTLTTLLL